MISTLKKLMKLVRHPVRYISGLTLVGILSAFNNIIIGLALMLFISAAETGDLSMLLTSIIYVALFLVALLLLLPLGYWLYETSVVHTTAHLRSQIFRRAIRLSAAWLEGRHSGDMTSRATNDAQAAEQAYSINTVNMVEVLLGGIGCAVAMFVVDWPLALAILAFGAVRVWVNSLFIKPLEKASNSVQQSLGLLTERLSDIANGGHVIRMFDAAHDQAEKYQQHNQQVKRHGLTRVRYSATVSWFNELNSQIAFVGLIVIGGWLVLQGWYTLGTIMFFVQLQNGVERMFRTFGQYITQLQTSLAGGRRALEIIDQPPEPPRIQLPQAPPTTVASAVSLDDVSFTYDKTQPWALENIDLKVEAGETVALVGPSGGGKSTIFKLLLGYYPPTKGSISLLNKSVDQYTLEQMRELTALVPQSAHLFSGTVAENIAMGRPGATSDEIIAAAKAANAHDFITQLPQGYDTPVGERGSRLSGGQRQRIAIARAIIRQAPLLLLDEATSALDTESEELVQQALSNLMANQTTLVIAHRLATVRDAHRIVVIADGQVAEQGTHDELLKKNGLYKRLHDMQFAEDLPSAG